jgi:germacradienol/geosmin synthase
MPYPSKINKNLQRARANAADWAARMGMLDGWLWDERAHTAFDLALCAASIHPRASASELDLTTGWLTWGTYADDYFPAVFGRSRDMLGAKLFHDRLGAFMPVDLSPVPGATNAVERGLADLWARTATPMAPAQRHQFRQAVTDMTASWLWELANQIQHRVPDPVDYLEMRRKTFGSDLTMSLARLRNGQMVPPGMQQSAADYACLTNDIFSYQKEIQFDGEFHNAVLIIQRFLDIGPAEAVAVTNDLMTQRLRQFEHLAANELPHLLEELEADARDGVVAQVEQLRDWMSGILHWHRATRRYRESELLHRHSPHLPSLTLPTTALLS